MPDILFTHIITGLSMLKLNMVYFTNKMNTIISYLEIKMYFEARYHSNGRKGSFRALPQWATHNTSKANLMKVINGRTGN